MNNSRRQGGYKKSFVIVLIAVLLSSCIFIGTMLAWLTQDITSESTGIHLGEVDLELYLNETKLVASTSNASGVTKITASEIVLSGGTTIREVDLSVRNTGNIDAIIRATISIYFKNENGDRVTLIIEDDITLDNGIPIQKAYGACN